MFIDSIDALAHTIAERWKREDLSFQAEQDGNRILNITVKTHKIQNGIKYCSVQVECENGETYHLEAYGEEADQLYHEGSNFRLTFEQEKSRLNAVDAILYK